MREVSVANSTRRGLQAELPNMAHVDKVLNRISVWKRRVTMRQVDPVQFPELYSNVVIHDPLITITNQGYFYNDRSTHAKALGGRGKCYFDFAISLIALLVLLPLLCFIA